MPVVSTYMRAFNTRKFVRWTIRNFPVFNRFAVWGDDLMGYGKPKIGNKWWFDLEDVDGELQIPSHAGSRGNNKPNELR